MCASDSTRILGVEDFFGAGVAQRDMVFADPLEQDVVLEQDNLKNS